MIWLYIAAGALAAWLVWARAELWLARFINAQQRQGDALQNIAAALLKRIEWEATCRRADTQEQQARNAMEDAMRKREALMAQRKLEVHDDLNLAPAAADLLGKLAARVPPAAPTPGPWGHSVTEYKLTLSGPPNKKPEPPPEAA